MTKYVLRGLAAVATLALALAYPALATKLVGNGVLVYSNLCVESESGDVSGYRIKVLRSTEGDRVYLEWSEGGCMARCWRAI